MPLTTAFMRVRSTRVACAALSATPVVMPASKPTTALPEARVAATDAKALESKTRLAELQGEVVSGALALIDNPNIDAFGLMQHIPGPDFPTGGIIYGKRFA
jgi:DNA gyrase subunit A